MRKNSIKNTRINSEVQRELSNLILHEIKDPRISKMTSVIDVEVAPDLKTAKVYISVLGNEEQVQETYKGLKSAAPFLRTKLAKTINLRNTPELIFVMDQSIEYGVNMCKLIDDVTAESHLDEKSQDNSFEEEVFDGGFEDFDDEDEEDDDEDNEDDNNDDDDFEDD